MRHLPAIAVGESVDVYREKRHLGGHPAADPTHRRARHVRDARLPSAPLQESELRWRHGGVPGLPR